MEQAAQLFTDYYEGEVNVKPSDLRYKETTYVENQEKTLATLLPIQFDQSPFPIIVVKKDGNIQDLKTTDKSPFPVTSIEPFINDGQVVTEDAFNNEQQLSNFGFLLVGYVNADSSLIGVLPHPADE